MSTFTHSKQVFPSLTLKSMSDEQSTVRQHKRAVSAPSASRSRAGGCWQVDRITVQLSIVAGEGGVRRVPVVAPVFPSVRLSVHRFQGGRFARQFHRLAYLLPVVMLLLSGCASGYSRPGSSTWTGPHSTNDEVFVRWGQSSVF